MRKQKHIKPDSRFDTQADELLTMLENSWNSPEFSENPDLTYLLERLGRKIISDDSIETSARHFSLLVKTLKTHAQLQHDQAQELNLCLSAGQTYAVMGLLDKAQDSYGQAIRLSRVLNDARAQARALRHLGNLKFQQQGLIKEAVKYFEQSLEICQENAELLDEAYALNSLSAAYFYLASWKKMGDASNQALAISEQLSEDELIACIYNNLGAMYCLRGQWPKALTAFQKSLPIFEQLADYHGLAETYNNMATLYRDQDLWNEAGKRYALSIRYASMVGDTVTKASAILNRAELYIMMHDLELARKNCLSAVSTFHQLGKKYGEADACKLLGVIYTKNQNWELAEKYFEESLGISTDCNHKLGMAETYQYYADLHLAQNNQELAIADLNKSLENFRSIKATRKAKKIDKKLKELTAAK